MTERVNIKIGDSIYSAVPPKEITPEEFVEGFRQYNKKETRRLKEKMKEEFGTNECPGCGSKNVEPNITAFSILDRLWSCFGCGATFTKRLVYTGSVEECRDD